MSTEMVLYCGWLCFETLCFDTRRNQFPIARRNALQHLWVWLWRHPVAAALPPYCGRLESEAACCSHFWRVAYSSCSIGRSWKSTSARGRSCQAGGLAPRAAFAMLTEACVLSPCVSSLLLESGWAAQRHDAGRCPCPRP
jgi:hypothetical protein